MRRREWLALAAGAPLAAATKGAVQLHASTYAMQTLAVDRALATIREIGYDGAELCLMAGWPSEPTRLDSAARRRIREDADIMEQWDLATRELIALGKACGIALPDDAADKAMAFSKQAPPAMMASMAHDLIRGGRIELPWLSGKVVALGRERGVPTPVHAVLNAVLKPHANGG